MFIVNIKQVQQQIVRRSCSIRDNVGHISNRPAGNTSNMTFKPSIVNSFYLMSLVYRLLLNFNHPEKIVTNFLLI